MAAAVLAAPSFSRTRARWFSTVSGLSPSRRATSLLVSPRAPRPRTPRPPTRGPLAWAPAPLAAPQRGRASVSDGGREARPAGHGGADGVAQAPGSGVLEHEAVGARRDHAAERRLV